MGYAKERFTFGRAIGSYQAIKHGLDEVLRGLENAKRLLILRRLGARLRQARRVRARGERGALGGGGTPSIHASRAMINMHGGIGATWEHDAPLCFRRAQLSRRLAGHRRRDRPRGRGDDAQRGRLARPAGLLGSPPA